MELAIVSLTVVGATVKDYHSPFPPLSIPNIPLKCNHYLLITSINLC